MLSRPGQLFYRWFSERGLFRVFMRVCVAGVLSAGACVVVGGSAGAGVPTTISLAGSFGGVTSVGTVIGAAQGRSATGLTGQSFLFYSVCTRLGANGTTPVPCGPVSYNFGDGTIRSGKGQVRHGFTVAGTYSVTATLEDGQYAVAQMQAIVSPYYLDVRGVASRAIWSLGSQGILGNCGGGLFCPHPTSEVPATRSTTLLGDTVPGATHVRVSSAVGVFIGQRISISTMSSFVSGVNGTIITVHPGLGPARARGTTVVLRPYLASALVNGVTGESCLVAPSACGLPASYFLVGGRPGACTKACTVALEAKGFLTTAGTPQLSYNSSNCADGYVAGRVPAGWVTTVGTEVGCVSREEFLRQLVHLSGGGGPKKSPCHDNSSALVRVGAGLGLTQLLVGKNGSCYVRGALSKAVAYEMLARLGHRSNAGAALGFKDVAGTTYAGAVGGELSAGVPFVGSSTCVRGGGTCFNGDEALTRGEEAQLLAGVLVGQGQVLGGPVVSLTAQGGALRAVVYPVTGEVAHSITVVLRTAGSRCVRRATLGGSPLTLECAFAHSSEKRLGTVSVSGGWGRSQSALLF